MNVEGSNAALTLGPLKIQNELLCKLKVNSESSSYCDSWGLWQALKRRFPVDSNVDSVASPTTADIAACLS